MTCDDVMKTVMTSLSRMIECTRLTLIITLLDNHQKKKKKKKSSGGGDPPPPPPPHPPSAAARTPVNNSAEDFGGGGDRETSDVIKFTRSYDVIKQQDNPFGDVNIEVTR